MVMSETARRYTVQEVLQFPEDGNRYELIGGELLVSPRPAPRHQRVVQRLYVVLLDYLRPLGLEETLYNVPCDISWNSQTLVEPDLFVTVPEELSSRWSTVRTLLLAVEVLSPNSGRADRVLKRRVYQENGVATYWIIDHEAGVVEVWRPDDIRPEVVTDVLKWRIYPDAAELAIDLAKLFGGLPE